MEDSKLRLLNQETRRVRDHYYHLYKKRFGGSRSVSHTTVPPYGMQPANYDIDYHNKDRWVGLQFDQEDRISTICIVYCVDFPKYIQHNLVSTDDFESAHPQMKINNPTFLPSSDFECTIEEILTKILK